MQGQGSTALRVLGRGRGIVLAALVTLLVGCVGGTREVEDWVAEVKAKRGVPLEPLPVQKTFEPFEYDAYELREPFELWDDADERAVSLAAGPRPDPNRRKEALENFPLDALDMVGTIGMGADVFGLVKAPDGVVYRVRPENYLGQSDGRITGIFEDRIELIELIPNGVGGWNEQPALIPLENQ